MIKGTCKLKDKTDNESHLFLSVDVIKSFFTRNICHLNYICNGKGKFNSLLN